MPRAVDPIRTFVTHFQRARYDDLPTQVVEAVKITILDTMGRRWLAAPVRRAGASRASRSDMAAQPAVRSSRMA
jgi:hypothetical protein